MSDLQNSDATPPPKTRPPRLKYESSSNRYYIDNYKTVNGKYQNYRHYFPKCINQSEALRRVQKLKIKLKPRVKKVDLQPSKPDTKKIRPYNFNTDLTYDKYLAVQNKAVDLLRNPIQVATQQRWLPPSTSPVGSMFTNLSLKYDELKKAFDAKVKDFENRNNSNYEAKLAEFEAKVNSLLSNNLENKEEVAKLRMILRRFRDEFKLSQKNQIDDIKTNIRDEIKAITADYDELKQRADLSETERSRLAGEYTRQLVELKQDMSDVRSRQRELEGNIRDLVDKADEMLEAAENSAAPPAPTGELDGDIQDEFKIIEDSTKDQPEDIDVGMDPTMVTPELPINIPPNLAREGKNEEMDPVEEVKEDLEDDDVGINLVNEEGSKDDLEEAAEVKEDLPTKTNPEDPTKTNPEDPTKPPGWIGEPAPPGYNPTPPVRTGDPFAPKNKAVFFAAFPDISQYEGKLRKPDGSSTAKVIAVRSRIRSMLKSDYRLSQQLQNLADFDSNILDAIYNTINPRGSDTTGRNKRNEAFANLVSDLKSKGLGERSSEYNLSKEADSGKDPNYPGLYSDDINKIMMDEDDFVGVISEDQIPYLPLIDVGGAVVNNGREHWYALYWSKPDGYIGYIDSLSLKPNEEAIKNIKLFGKKLAPSHYLKLKISDVVTQRANGNNCGWYACKILKDLFNGASFPSATNYGIHGMKLSEVLVDGKVKPSLIKQAEKSIKQFKNKESQLIGKGRNTNFQYV